jgi:hypothetical protein
MTGSRLQVIAERLSQSLNSGVRSCHESAMYEYAIENHAISSSPEECLIRITGVRTDLNTVKSARGFRSILTKERCSVWLKMLSF